MRTIRWRTTHGRPGYGSMGFEAFLLLAYEAKTETEFRALFWQHCTLELDDTHRSRALKAVAQTEKPKADGAAA